MKKINIAILFGGVSSEHEISLLSAGNIMRSIPRDKYELLPVGITKQGRWLYCPNALTALENGNWEKSADAIAAYISPDASIKGLVTENGILPIDVVFPVLHGKGGEDGTVQGLLSMAQIPYVGCGVLSSALCMDKIAANRVLDASGVARCEWLGVTKRDILNAQEVYKKAEAALGFPLFVKPANAGSSVGVSKAHNIAELENAIALAFKHDSRVILERFVKGREIECAVMGNQNPFASRPGEILASKEFYDYEDKYLAGTSKTQIPANLPENVLTEIQETAVYAYKSLACEGLARVDFFVEDGTDKVLINEINTMPGFTAISMYPKLMQEYGMSYGEICDKLIKLALEKGV